MPTVLHLGAGAGMMPVFPLLRAAGWRVLAMDGNADAPGFVDADQSWPLDFSNPDFVEQVAKEGGADAIIAGNEPGVWSAAVACERLGLPGLPPAVAHRCVHKGEMRDAWAAAGLPQPDYERAVDAECIRSAAARLGYPLVIKPARGWGSRGISRVTNADDLDEALAFATEWSRGDDFVVERCITGTELTAEGLVCDGHAETLATSDKEHQQHPRFLVAMALNYPAAIPPQTDRDLQQLMQQATTALGLRNGPFHAEVMLTDSGLQLLELGARGGGGFIMHAIVEAVSGISMPLTWLSILRGDHPDIRPRVRRGACYRFFNAPPGIYRGVAGLDDARAAPGIRSLEFAMKPETRVGPVSGDADRPGACVSEGATRDEARQRADAAIAMLRFDMDTPAMDPGS